MGRERGKQGQNGLLTCAFSHVGAGHSDKRGCTLSRRSAPPRNAKTNHLTRAVPATLPVCHVLP